MKKFHGSCQCGKVEFSAGVDLDQTITCNCSRCERLGMVLAMTPKAEFELLTGKENLTEYRFHSKNIAHLFCKTCGVESFAFGVGQNGQEMCMINVNVLDDIDPRALASQHYDG